MKTLTLFILLTCVFVGCTNNSTRENPKFIGSFAVAMSDSHVATTRNAFRAYFKDDFIFVKYYVLDSVDGKFDCGSTRYKWDAVVSFGWTSKMSKENWLKKNSLEELPLYHYEGCAE